MKPKDIRALYAQESAATEAEDRHTQQEAMTDPEAARSYIHTLTALASANPAFDALFQAFMVERMMEVIAERIATDDAYALHCAQQLVALMKRTSPAHPPERPARGKPKAISA